jgi:hypothetical protein
MAGWRRPIESAVNEVEVAAPGGDQPLALGAGDPGGAGAAGYRESRSFLRWGVPWGCTIRRSGAAWSGPQSKARWQRSMIGRARQDTDDHR